MSSSDTPYRTNAKPMKIVYVDFSKVPSKYREWFLEGVKEGWRSLKEALNEED